MSLGIKLSVDTHTRLATHLDGVSVRTPREIAGSRLHVWVEIGVSPHTLDGSGLYTQIDDLSGNGYHMTQANAADRPRHATSGGPLGKPYLSIEDLTDSVGNTSIALSAGRRLSFFVVAQADTVDARTCFAARDGADNQTMLVHRVNSTTSLMRATFQTSGVQSVNVTTPALSTGWRRYEQHYDAGAIVATMDGTAIDPAYTTGSGEPCAAVERFDWGYFINTGNISGGRGYLFVLGEDLTSDERAAMRAYVLNQAGV